MKTQANPVQQIVLIITVLCIVPVVYADKAMPSYQWIASPTTVALYQVPVGIEPDDSLKIVGLCRYRLLLSDQYLAGIGVGEDGCLPLPDADGIEQEESPPEYLVQKPYQHIPLNQTSTASLQAIAAYTDFQGSTTELAEMSDTGIFPCFYTRQSRQLMGLALVSHESRLSSDCCALLITDGEVEWGAHHPLVAYLSPELEKTETGKAPELSESEDNGLGEDEVFILAILPLVAVSLGGLPACWCLIKTCQCLRECGEVYGPPCRAGWAAFFQSIGRGITAMAGYCLKCPQCCSQLLVSAVEASYGKAGEDNRIPASTAEVVIDLDSEPRLPGRAFPPACSETTVFPPLPDYETAIQMPAASVNSYP